MPKQRRTIRVEDATWAWLKQQADADRRSVSAWLDHLAARSGARAPVTPRDTTPVPNRKRPDADEEPDGALVYEAAEEPA